MSSTFGGLEMGKSALNAFRLGMQTVGHNISNMNTDGYSRQRVVFSTVTPEDIAHVGQLGQGMYASTIERIRDEFLDFQYRDNNATLGYWEKINDLYDSIQNYIAEPNSTGLRASMDTFFTNMQTLQKSPEDTSARRALVESANSIGGMLSNLVYNFNTYNESINMQIQQSVTEANGMLYDLAALNQKINEAETLDQNANDLYDKRDVILDKLSKMMDISYNEPITKNGVKGEFFLSVNGRVLVQGTHVRELKAHTFMWDNQVYYDVQVAENEFDIVDNMNVAEALATGPEGTYQLTVDRIANGVEWTAGGGNAHCLDTIAVATSDFDTKITVGGAKNSLSPVEVQSSKITDGIILNKNSDEGPYTLSFEMTDSSGTASNLNVSITKTDTLEIQTSRLKNTITDISNGVILDKFSDDGPYTLSFTTNNGTTTFTIERNSSGTGWDLSDGTNTTTISSDNLKLTELANFINSNATDLTATLNSDNTMTFKASGTATEISLTDSKGLLGTITEKKYWTISDGTTSTTIAQEDLDITSLASYINGLNKGFTATADTENNIISFRLDSPLNLSSSIELTDSNNILGNVTQVKDPEKTILGYTGDFSIQLGAQTSETSETFDEGIILSSGNSGDTYTFRISIAGDNYNVQTDITAAWDGSAWNLTSSADSYSDNAGSSLTVQNLTKFIRTALSEAEFSGLDIQRTDTNFTVNAQDGYKFSITDINGTLAEKLGIANGNPKANINVTATDTLASIRDKINSAITSSYSGFTGVKPNASIDRGYLTINADIEDESQIIVLISDSDDNKTLLANLGLIDDDGNTYSDEDEIILNSSSKDIPYKLSFKTFDENGKPLILNIKIDKAEYINSENANVTGWQLRAELDGEEVSFTTDSKGNKIYNYTEGENLTLEELKDFINKVAEENDIYLEANEDENSLVFTSTINDGISPIEVTDYSGMLGAITEAKKELETVNMRVEPKEITDALNISGSFRIQVGTQGTRVTSNVFRENAAKGLGEGDILGTGELGEKHTFRIGVSGDQVDFSAIWNSSTGKWVLSSDLGTTATAGEALSVKDLTDFINTTLKAASNSDNPALTGLKVTAGKSSSGTLTQFSIESKDNYLLSVSDVEGNLAERLGIVNENPVITIDVENSDSLVTIRNKINEKYQAEFGLTEPEQWVHASVDKGYLEISANVAGEAQRVTLMGSEDGNMQVLRRLGLTRNQEITSEIKVKVESDDDEEEYEYKTFKSYREVAYIPDSGVAHDASFTLNGVRYLSSDNKFNMARRIPAASGDSSKRYSATELSEVSEGMWLNLKSAGNAIITVRHHIRDGSIKGLEEARDEMIPNLKSELDEMAYGLIKHINAYQYSGYGVASDITTTGVSFFDVLTSQSGASEKLKVNDKVAYDPSLIGAAMGLKDENGLALKGVSGGSGDGTNASRMNGLNFAKVLENGTMTISGIYDAMLSQIGTEAGHANLMYTTQATVSEQIDGQRQAVSGVNLDEELMDMVILNRAFGAMSRYITTMDEMLNTIINGMGLVGR